LLRALWVSLALALLAVGAWLRAGTWPWHSNLWSVDWLSYYEPQAAALGSGRLWAWAGSWEGLHPPVSGIVHGTLMALGVPLLGHWMATVTAGLAAIGLLAWMVGKEGRGPLAVLLVLWAALSPLQVNYGLNTSPYPWTLLLVASSLWMLTRVGLERRAWLMAAVLTGLAVQTHVLAFAVAVAQALWLAARSRGQTEQWRAHALRWAQIVGVFCVPMVIGSLSKTSDPWTFHIEGGGEHWSRTAWLVLHERFGARPSALWLGGTLGALGLVGAARRPREVTGLLVLSAVGWLAALWLFIELGVADPRLSHYYLVPHLLLLAAGTAGASSLVDAVPVAHRSKALWALVIALAGVSAAWVDEALRTELGRQAEAHRQLSAAEAARTVIRRAFADAGDGDVVAYLWDHQFLNDEPEYLDPYAGWPLSAVGRGCREEHPPRGLCNARGEARFYFDPSAFTGPLYELEEPLRLMVNQAHPPGQAQIVLVPGPDAPPRPFPAESWMEGNGAARSDLGDGVAVWTFPVGARVEPPNEPLEPPESE